MLDYISVWLFVSEDEYWSLHSAVSRLSKRDKRRQLNEEVSETETLNNKNNGQSQRMTYKSIMNGMITQTLAKRFQLKIQTEIYLPRKTTYRTGGRNILKQF